MNASDNEMRKGEKGVLVTGASGFVGSALIRELEAAGAYRVFGLVGNRKKNSVPFGSTTKFFPSDISDYETLRDCETLNDIDTVVHAAGLAHQFGETSCEEFWKVNVQGTLNVCRLAKALGTRRFIHISSVAVYGEHGNAEIVESFECRPEGDYSESKRASELKAIEFCEQNGIPLMILRLGTVIGEGDRGNTTRLITLIDKNRFLWIGKGANKKSLIYKGDVAGGILKVIEAPEKTATGTYNLTARAISMAEIVGVISKALKNQPPRVSVPERLVRMLFLVNKLGIPTARLRKFEKTFEKWLSDDVFSGDKFYKAFGFEPATPIAEALERQANFYLEQKKRDF